MADQALQLHTHRYRPGLELDYACGLTHPKALVVHAHGGSFLTGNRRDRLARYFSTKLARSGLAFASIDYRKGGQPLDGVPHDQLQAIRAAQSESQRLYPEITPRLFGPLLYRAAEDFGLAVDWLRSAPDGPGLSDVPLIVMGLSAGAMAAMAYAWGLDGMKPFPVTPVLALGVAAVPPQPWRLTAAHPTQAAILVARGDATMPRAAVARLADDMLARACKLEIGMIPYGQHNRPVKELIPPEGHAAGVWHDWFLARIDAAIEQSHSG